MKKTIIVFLSLSIFSCSYEIKGDLQVSKKWLTEAFTISGSAKSQRYIDIINQRIREELLLVMQDQK